MIKEDENKYTQKVSVVKKRNKINGSSMVNERIKTILNLFLFFSFTRISHKHKKYKKSTKSTKGIKGQKAQKL